MALGRQNTVELRRGEQDWAGDAVEIPERQVAVSAQRVKRLVADRAAQRPVCQIDRVRRGNELAVAHDVA